MMRFLSYHEKAVRGTFDFPIERYYVDSSHPRYEMPFHWHMESELILVRQGALALSVDGQPLRLAAGESAYIHSGAVHGGSPENCIYECIVFDNDRFFQDSAICRDRFRRLFTPDMQTRLFYAADSAPGRLIRSLFAAMEAEQPGYEFLTTGLLWQFMGIILQQHLYDAASGEARRRTQRAEQIKRALLLIRTDYSRKITLEALARQADMAPRYFCRVFREVTGRTPINYLNYYRVECAAELLYSTAESITEVALTCGFDDPGYFSRLFRRYKNTTPGAFRAGHTAEN